MADPSAQGLLALARGGGHNGVADALSPGMSAWQGAGWGTVYQAGTSLPRAFETFRDGQFGPLDPLQPFPIDVPEPPGGRPRVRRWLYPVALNIFTGQPGTEGLMLTNFQMQEDTAEQPSVPRALIESCRNDILNLIGDDLSENIVPTPMAEKAMQGNPAKRKDFESRKGEILDFLSNPDPDGHSKCFSDWLSLLLEDNIVIDAVAVNVQPTMKKGAGPAGSSLGALAAISGDMIKPLIDIHGGRPRPPQSSYQQIAWGIPRVDLMDLMADFGPDTSLDDLTALNPVLESLMEDADQFGADQLLYVVQNRRPRPAIYGFSPVAQCMLAASILFARQLWQFDFFQSSSIPTVFLDPGESVATAEEARQLQEAINMLGGNLDMKHQVIVLPPGSKVMPQKDVDLTSQIDEWLVALLCMSFGKSISDLGLTPKVAALMSPQASRGAAQVSSDRTTKAATIPRSKAFKDQLFDVILQRHLGQQDMMWSWGIEEGGESLKDKIDQEIKLVEGQLSTIDESRIRLGWEPLGLPETGVPIVKIATGVVPLGSPAMAALAEAPPPPPPPGLPPGGGGPPRALPPGSPSAKPKPAPKPPAGSAKPAPEKPAPAASPAAAGARQAAGQSENTAKVPASSKAFAMVDAEAGILLRYLRKGRDLDSFVPKALSLSALHAGRHAGPDPIDVVSVVKKVARRQARRDSTLEPMRTKVAAALVALGTQVQKGTLAPAAFAPAAADTMQSAYADAYTSGSDHAGDDYPDADATDDWGDEATQRADGQHSYLADFGAAIAAGMTVAALSARADQYGESLTPAYEEAYGQTVTDSMDEPTITWRSQGDDSVCQNCDALDGETFTADDLPGWPGDGTFGGEDGLCVLGETLVQSPLIEETFRRWYEGPVVHVATAGGRTLACTPNHPVLTDKGWIRADLLQVGDRVVGARLADGVGLGDPHIEDRPTRVDEVCAALAVTGLGERVAPACLNLDGDGVLNSDVDVVRTDGELRDDGDPAVLKPKAQFDLMGANGLTRGESVGGHLRLPSFDVPWPGEAHSGTSGTGDRSLGASPQQLLVSERVTTPFGGFGTVSTSSSLGQGTTLFSGTTGVDHLLALAGCSHDPQRRDPSIHHVPRNPVGSGDGVGTLASEVPLSEFGERSRANTLTRQNRRTPKKSSRLRERSWTYAARQKAGPHRLAADLQVLGDLLLRGAAEVSLDDVVHVQVETTAAFVFNLRTHAAWYLANGIVVHNCEGGPMCRCWLDYSEGGDVLATSDQPSGARTTAEGPLTADEAAAQLEGADTPPESDSIDSIDGGKARKDFGAGGVPGPGGPVAMVPFDLTGAGNRRVPNNVGERKKPKKKGKHKAVGVDTLPPVPARTALDGQVAAAGVAVRAEDTGRILVQQRAMADDDDRGDPAAGTWEFPGGHLDPGETPWAAAEREFQEETGMLLPGDARVVTTWVSPNGVYETFLVSVPLEADLPLNSRFGGLSTRQALMDLMESDSGYSPLVNPDDPDGDNPEVCAWFTIDQLANMGSPPLRPELAATAPWSELRTPLVTTVYRGVSADFVAKASPGMLVTDDADGMGVTNVGLLLNEPWVARIDHVDTVGGVGRIPAGTVLKVVSVEGRVVTLTKDWDESAHPRDEHGRFVGGGGDTVTAGPGRMAELRNMKPSMETILRYGQQMETQHQANMAQVRATANKHLADVEHEDKKEARITAAMHVGFITLGVLLTVVTGPLGMAAAGAVNAASYGIDPATLAGAVTGMFGPIGQEVGDLFHRLGGVDHVREHIDNFMASHGHVGHGSDGTTRVSTWTPYEPSGLSASDAAAAFAKP